MKDDEEALRINFNKPGTRSPGKFAFHVAKSGTVPGNAMTLSKITGLDVGDYGASS